MEEKHTNLFKIAKLISVVAHPLVLLPATVLLVMVQNSTPTRILQIVFTIILVSVIPTIWVIHRKVVAGKWSNYDISDSVERTRFYPRAIAICIVSGVVFYLLNFPQALIIGISISLLLLITAMIINFWSKISLHSIFAAYCAISSFAVGFWTGGIFLMVAILLGWSRIKLERHSFWQVFSGEVLGAIGALALLKLNNVI